MVLVQLKVGPLDPNPVRGHSPISKCITEMNIIGSWQNLQIVSLVSVLKQVEASETASPHPSHNGKQRVKAVRVRVPIKSPLIRKYDPAEPDRQQHSATKQVQSVTVQPQ